MSCFLRVSCYFQHLKKKNSGGGGGVLKYFFFLILRFMLLSTLQKILLKSAPSLNG